MNGMMIDGLMQRNDSRMMLRLTDVLMQYLLMTGVSMQRHRLMACLIPKPLLRNVSMQKFQLTDDLKSYFDYNYR
jgi:hypothetical protein